MPGVARPAEAVIPHIFVIPRPERVFFPERDVSNCLEPAIQEELRVRRFSMLMIVSVSLCLAVSAEVASNAPATAPETFTLWQLPNQTHVQMMSYVIQTPDGSLLVIDGGNTGDADYLREFILARGAKVSTWIITPVHSDHVNAIIEILKEPGAITVDTFYGSIPEREWVAAHGGESELATWDALADAFAQSGHQISELAIEQRLTIDTVNIRVLGIKNPEITANPINNSSIAFRLWDTTKSVLFTGDLGVEGGDKLLNSDQARHLPADYIQMAHHGQRGVSEAFYTAVNPSFCLWPTPKWLWDNDNGGGPDSGPWKTLEVRAWMDKLSIQRHYVMHEGLHEIR